MPSNRRINLLVEGLRPAIVIGMGMDDGGGGVRTVLIVSGMPGCSARF
jgi:hypothetical protein